MFLRTLLSVVITFSLQYTYAIDIDTSCGDIDPYSVELEKEIEIKKHLDGNDVFFEIWAPLTFKSIPLSSAFYYVGNIDSQAAYIPVSLEIRDGRHYTHIGIFNESANGILEIRYEKNCSLYRTRFDLET